MRSRVLACSLLVVGCGLVEDVEPSAEGDEAADAWTTEGTESRRLVAIEHEGRMQLVDYSDLDDVRVTTLSETIWGGYAPPAWAPDRRAFAWVSDDTYHVIAAPNWNEVLDLAVQRGRVTAGVHWLSESELLLGRWSEPGVLWTLTSGQSATHPESWSTRQRAGGGFVYHDCDAQTAHFRSPSGEVVDWDRDWRVFLHPEGKRIALVVSPEDQALAPDHGLVDLVVLPHQPSRAIDCSASNAPYLGGPIAGHVHWSPAGRLYAEIWEAQRNIIRFGTPPLDDSASEVPLFPSQTTDPMTAFLGDSIFYFRRSGVGLQSQFELWKTDEAGTTEQLAVLEPGWFPFLIAAPGQRDLLTWFAESADETLGVQLFAWNPTQGLLNLGPAPVTEFLPQAALWQRQPEQRGGALSLFTGEECFLEGARCEARELRVWLASLEDSSEPIIFDAYGAFSPEGQGLLLVEDGNLTYRALGAIDVQHVLTPADDVFIPALATEASE